MRKTLLLLIILCSFRSYSQLLDDSTELVYGPATTRYVFESDILNNQLEYTQVDTSLYMFDQRSFYDRNRRRYQNLGNFGTAVFPVFHTPQKDIGRTSGFNAFAPYAGQEGIKFYDTKSPFIDLLVYLGSGNKNLVNVGFSRNVREGWNFGFDLSKITADKLIARDAVGDRQTENTAFDFYTHYKNQKAPYQMYFYVKKLSHKVAEPGGVRFGTDSVFSDLFRLKTALPRLEDAQSSRKETRWHLYQDYQVAEQFQIYHSIDLYDEENTYKDARDGLATLGYDTYSDPYNSVFLIDTDSTAERSSMSATTNELGFKGDLSSVFYRAYVKLRTVDFRYFLLDPFARRTEKYVGGYARFKWKEKFSVEAEGEVSDEGFYSFAGTLNSELIRLKYESKNYSVPFIYQAYFGNHFAWSNDFSPVFVNRLEGNLKLNYKAFTFIPKAIFTSYTNFLYFNESQLPAQASTGIVSGSVGGEVKTALINRKGEGIYLENEVLATSVTGSSADAMRIPGLFYNGRYFWRGMFFGDKVPVEVGIDTHARSSYFANSFQPATQQFYVQNELENEGYFKADFFITMRLDKFFFGIKWAHLDQPQGDGYFTTPWYPGQPKGIDLMIQWRFFD